MSWTPLLALILAWAPAGAQERGPETAVERFRRELELVRAGQEPARARLLEAARELCELHGRCDAVDVAAHYASLDTAALAAGRGEEERFLALRARVLAAREQGLAGGAWARERQELLEELDQLASRVETAADFVPAAQARSLRARLLVQQVEEDPALSPEQRGLSAARAEDDARRADTLFARAGQRTPRLEPAWLLGRLALVQGRHGAARERFEHCLTEAEALANDDFKEHALEGLLALALAQGDRGGQRSALERLARFRDPRTCWPLASGWAGWLLHDDQAARAYDFLARHPPPSDTHPVQQDEWELLMGGALLRLGDLPGAREHLERASAGGSEGGMLALADLALREERAFEVEALLGDGELLAQLSAHGQAEARRILGEALLSLGELDEAVAHLSAALELAETWSERLALDASGRWAGAGPRGFAESAARGVIGEWIGLHTVALLADAHRRRGDPLAALQVIEDSQSRSLRDDEALRAVRLRAGEPTRRPVSPQEIAAWARQAELGLVTWVVGADFSVCVWAGPGENGELVAEAARIERGRKELLDAGRRLREAALAGDQRWLGRETALLAETLFPAAIAERLRLARGGAEVELPRLLLLLHGPLESMPLELLDLPGLLGADAALLALPGLPEPLPGAAAFAGGPWHLLGAPVDERLQARLPGAGDELAALAAMHPGALVAAGAEFTRRRLEEALASGLPLHVATHLVERCDAAPLSVSTGALEVSGGEQLCASGIAALRPRSPIVVLSACAGGAGRYLDAEGLHGVGRAFLAAGSRNLLASLWPVEDAAARAFSLEFHGALAEGLSPARGAHRARARLRAAGHPPADWAAWRLLGRD